MDKEKKEMESMLDANQQLAKIKKVNVMFNGLKDTTRYQQDNKFDQLKFKLQQVEDENLIMKKGSMMDKREIIQNGHTIEKLNNKV
tara:strand:+ start:120 stop:377 length:258 start_codon:yes stop_codon:yes gene_type:complete